MTAAAPGGVYGSRVRVYGHGIYGTLNSPPRSESRGTELTAGAPSALPEFEAPPIVEVALGVQFTPQFALRPIELGPLRERWRDEYPVVQEMPLLPPAIEASMVGSPVAQLVIGPAIHTRLWFLTADQSWLVQLQHDRLTVNWRQITAARAYPRYSAVRDTFMKRWRDLASHLDARGLGEPELTQVEVTYINAIDTGAEGLGDLARILKTGRLPSGPLGDPEQARLGLAFNVPDIGRVPVRLHVTLDPGQRPDGTTSMFLTLALRGTPADRDILSGLQFMEGAHSHVVRTFADLTTEELHREWKRVR